MTLLSAVNPRPVDPDALDQQQAPSTPPTAPPGAEGLEFEEARLRSPGQGRRIAIIALGVILVGMALTIMGLAFAQSSWWYTYETDRVLDHTSQAGVEAILDQVDASGAAPEAVKWLNAALVSTHPTDVRSHLITAQEILRATDDPKLIEAAEELGAIIGMIRPSRLWRSTTPTPAPTLEWPWYSP